MYGDSQCHLRRHGGRDSKAELFHPQMTVWANRCLIYAPEFGIGGRKEALLAVIWGPHPIPDIKAKNLQALKDRTKISGKTLQIFVLKTLWEHIEFGSWKQSSISTLDFSQFHIFLKNVLSPPPCSEGYEFALLPIRPIHIKLVTLT